MNFETWAGRCWFATLPKADSERDRAVFMTKKQQCAAIRYGGFANAEVDNKVPLPKRVPAAASRLDAEQLPMVRPDNDDESERLKKAWKGPGLLIVGSNGRKHGAVERFVAALQIRSLLPLKARAAARSGFDPNHLALVQDFLREQSNLG